ncbi:PAS domain S-box protein [Minwuia thermotolerans]|uniref:PAS domain S-box protein n=1 Tax=Minwuia thermotolerans TaxID=2056226 RepID=UPI0013DE6D50|nr:PAS domain S-box protein [Minwuia thermotolerans]
MDFFDHIGQHRPGAGSAESGIVVVGADGRVGFSNDRFREIHALPRHLMLVGLDYGAMAQNLADHVHRLGLVGDAGAFCRTCFPEADEAGEGARLFESAAMRIEAEVTSIAAGGFVLVHRVLQDREQLRRIEAIERRFADVMEAFADWYWETDADHRFVYVGNPVGEHTLLRVDEFVGLRRWEVPGAVEPPEAPFWLNHRRTLDRREAFRDFRYARRVENDAIAHFSIDGKPVFNRAGAFIGYRGVGREISHLVEMERRVAESDRRFRDIIEGSLQGVMVHVDGRIVFANPKMAEILGYENHEELLELASIHELFWPEERSRLEGYRQARLMGEPAPEEYELRAMRRDGSMIWVENRARTIEWEGRLAVQATIYDITERKKAWRDLERAEQRLAGILDIAPEAIMSVDEASRIRIFNKGAQRLFGYAEEEMLGQRVERLMPGRFRGLHEKRMAEFARSDIVSRPMNLRGEIIGLRRDGAEFPAEASISKLKLDGHWLFNVTIQDITERKRAQADLIAAREAAEAANRAKSEFLWNMSHELRTPLNAIIGFAELIGGEMFGPVGQERYVDYARDIHVSGQHLLALINEILDLSRIEAGVVELHEEAVDVAAELDGAVRMLEPRARRERKTVRVAVPRDLPRVRADARMLRQIFINLISNAVQYSEDGGEIRIGAGRTDGARMAITVADDGVGIPEEDMERIFRPFARASQVASKENQGYGLGLPLARKFCDLHRIALDIDSTVGVGTTVRLEVPSDRVL